MLLLDTAALFVATMVEEEATVVLVEEAEELEEDFLRLGFVLFVLIVLLVLLFFVTDFDSF